MTEPLPGWYNDLDAFEAHAWAMLARGAADRRSPFHTPALATVGADGAPRVRTVVLRGVDVSERVVRVHSDARADKVAGIERTGRAELMGYDRGAKLQLRASGPATVHRADGVADAAWEATRSFSRACYRVEPRAGARIEAGGDYAQPSDGEDGRENFAVIRVRVEALEALYLAAAGHRRARFAPGDRAWLVP